jgi:hypothetical protein
VPRLSNALAFGRFAGDQKASFDTQEDHWQERRQYHPARNRVVEPLRRTPPIHCLGERDAVRLNAERSKVLSCAKPASSGAQWGSTLDAAAAPPPLSFSSRRQKQRSTKPLKS